jgi:hypothetical protein
MCAALARAHDLGVVHRDLKSDNIMLTVQGGRRDFVKILDFGLAALTRDARLAPKGAVFGTPEYMAPEQAAGRNDTDGRVDIYALGTILYEMVVGKVPHKGDSMIRTIAMQMLDPITPPRQVNPDLPISPGLEAAIMKALAKNRDERYPTMDALLVALDSLHDEIVASHPTISLPALPPGADSAVLAPPMTSAQLEAPAPPPRRSKGETRPLHEPEFVGAPLTFDPVFQDAPEPQQRRRWPLLALGLVVVLIGAGAAILVLSHVKHETAVADAAFAERPIDASLVVIPADAEPAPADAEQIVLVPADAGVRPARDAGMLAPHPATVRVTVYVRPGDALVYTNGNYRGPANTTIEEPWGRKVKIECKTSNMKGSVSVVFDGSKTNVMCTATRQRFCVEGIKNPFDDCEERPN